MPPWKEVFRALSEKLPFSNNRESKHEGAGSTLPGRPDPLSPPVRKGVKDQEACCTSVTTVAFYERKEPAIILKNNSSYQVSFWVIEEDKTNPTTSAALEKISKEMGAPLDHDTPSGSSTTSATETAKGREDCYILTADHRVDNWGTNVSFLKGSNDMRVLGFFRKDSSETWRRYKNRVYSIRRGKKIFTLVATDENIKRHQAEKDGR